MDSKSDKNYPTPRTDHAAQYWRETLGRDADPDVWAFARQLERELVEAKAEQERLRDKLLTMPEDFGDEDELSVPTAERTPIPFSLIHDLIEEGRHQLRLAEDYQDGGEFNRIADELLKAMALSSRSAEVTRDSIIEECAKHAERRYEYSRSSEIGDHIRALKNAAPQAAPEPTEGHTRLKDGNAPAVAASPVRSTEATSVSLQQVADHMRAYFNERADQWRRAAKDWQDRGDKEQAERHRTVAAWFSNQAMLVPTEILQFAASPSAAEERDE